MFVVSGLKDESLTAADFSDTEVALNSHHNVSIHKQLDWVTSARTYASRSLSFNLSKEMTAAEDATTLNIGFISNSIVLNTNAVAHLILQPVRSHSWISTQAQELVS